MGNQEPKVLNLNKDYSAEILSWYLWGQSKAPSKAEIADAKWIDREENITLEVNTQEFLKKAGDFVNAKDFRLFETFFSGKTVSGNKLNNGNPTLNEGQYERFENGLYFLNQEQFANLFYGEYKNSKDKEYLKSYNSAENPAIDGHPAAVSFYNRNLDNPDFAKLAFTFGSIDVGLNTSKIRYVLDENLNPILVKDIEYQFKAGDFNFEGGKGSGLVNHILNQIADPSAIGKTVKFKFTDETIIDGGSINKSDYDSMKELKEYEIDGKSKIIDSDFYNTMLFKFWPEFKRIVSTGVIDYLDENGKIVMFKGNEKDKMIGTQAANFDYSDDVDVDWFPDAAADLLLNHYKKHIPNGITYIGGAGADIIAGTKYDDILYGYDRDGKNDDGAEDTLIGGEGADKMYGGKGFDTYYAGDKDIIEDTDGQGRVFFNDSILTGGAYDKEKGVYLSEDGKTEYKLLADEKLIVKKDGGTVAINGYKKDFKDENGNAYLSITLVDTDEIGISIDDNQTNEGDSGKKSLDFNISLQGSIEKGEFLILGVGDKEYLFGDPSEEYIKKYNLNLAQYERGNTYTYTWEGNTIKQEDRKFDVTPTIIQTSDKLKAKILKHGTGKIIDDDRDLDDPETDGSPIVIDLNNDGINTLSLDYTRNFDLDNNGFAEATGWVQKDDALLAYDRNGNGKIDNGGELFGNYTLSDNYYSHTSGNTNGFNAFKEFDTNNDGIIDKNDKDFNKLLLWQDKNSNAITDEGELIKLSDKVKSIDLNYKEISTDNNGNSIRQTSDATLNDGTKVKADDVWFKVSLNKTKEIIDQDKIPLETQALPQVIASGNLNSLRMAAGKNEKLVTMINLYLMLSPEERKKHIDELIYEWTGVGAIDKNSMRGDVKARDMAVYEKITGKPFNQSWRGANPGPNASNRVNDKINTFKRYVYATIELQTTYFDMDLNLDLMNLREDGKLSYKFDALNSKLIQLYKDGKHNEIIKLMSIVRDASAYKPIFQKNLKEDLVKLGSNDDKLLSLCLNTYMGGTDGNDVINGNSEDNFIVGGKGKDTLNGGAGDDTYVFARGDGNDTIYDTAGDDKIQFRESITPNDVSLKRELDKLIISIKSNDDSITIQNFFSVNPEIGNNAVRTIVFADGTVYDFNKILELAPLNSTDKNDKLYLTDGNDIFNAGSGNDEIWGGNGDDIINGNEGNDVLYGNDGNDTLMGGKGNDKLEGGNGNDTYVFNKGDGNDIITDYGGINTLQFGEGISRSDLEFNVINSGSDLKISFKNSQDDSIIINQANIENIKFINGEILKLSDIFNSIKIIGTEGDDVIHAGINTPHIIEGGDGNDIISSNNYTKLINGGKGDDWLNGGEGNDTYIFNKGDGTDTIIDHGGNNILKLGVGLDKKDLIISQDYNRYILLSFKDNVNDSIIFTSTNIQLVEFANGDKMSIDEIKKLSLTGDDTDNTIYGYNGENNTLIGNGGNDTLYGGDRNNILIGGVGNDTLIGGYSDDTYVFNKGDGNDIISDYNSGINTLQFGEGISKNDLEFNVINSASDLKISFKNSPNDSIVINQANIKNIKFANGEIIKLSNIDSIKIIGTGGDDIIHADINTPHIIEGGDGNDIISSNGYTKLINGGKGDDKLYGEGDDDIYIFNKGDGNDIINDIRGSSKIKFGEGINKEDISFVRKRDKLIILIKGDEGKINDSITILDFFYTIPEISISNNPIKTISFADGSIYDFNKILELVPLSSTDEDDEVYLTKKNDIFDAGLGNDKIWGNDGDDIIDGNKGNDSLFGDNGNDTLIGGKGNDELFGGKGNDIYIFNKGDGHDTITDGIGNNVIKFGEGINKEDLVINRSPYNETSIKFFFKNNTNDSIDVNSIGTLSIEFANGDKLGFKEMKKLPLFGSDANDTIHGFLSNRNTFIGNGGDDILEGEYGDDIYIFNKGDGRDTIVDYGGGIDVIKLNDFNYSDIEIKRDGNNLVINSKISDDSITIREFYYFEEQDYFNSIEYIKFKDGSIYNLLNKKFIVATNENDRIFLTNLDDEINGLDGDDVINGQGGNDILIGGKGNDALDGGDDNDTLIGGEGNDTLYGEGGNDVLTGGIGDDILKGGNGNDIYIFNKGDGNDMIYEQNGKDAIKFNDFNADDVILKREFNNLIISSKISNDVITISGFFHAHSEYEYAIENIIFKDGSIWDYKAILDNSAIKATEGDDKICLGNGDDNFNALGGDDEIYGEGGNDTIAGGDGNDKLDGGEGDDILYGNKGDDILNGGNGDDTLNGGGGDDKLYGWDGDDTIVGENGNDILNGGNGGDTLNGGAGNDIINGDEGNDTLIGGKNDDILNGGYGDDAYIFNRGDGKDTITDNQGTDTVKFGEGISKEDIIVKRVARMNDYTKQKEYSDIVILFKNSPNDSITLRDVTHGNSINENNVIETFEFSNGDKLSSEDIKKLSLIGTDNSENIIGYVHSNNIIKGGGGDDKLYGQGWNDTMYGGDGNDLIESGSGNDILIGDKGNDTLKGGIGDDILIGGAGNDTLNGGADNDTYVYNKGDGNDIIEEWGGIDTIKFGEGIQKKDLIISRDISKNSYYLSNAKDIIIKFKHNETDSITLKNVINANKTGIYSAIENFEFANGEKLSFEDIKQLSLVGTDEGETINGFEDSNNTLIGNGGNDWLYGDKKNDILIGGEGDDHLRGNEGDDTYIYNIGDGNDTIHDYEGEDIIKFGKGINKEDIIVTKGEVKYDSYTRSSYQDLVISLKGKQGSISLEHTISRDNGIYEKYSHKALVFENGDKLSFDDILKLSLIGNDENNDIYGYSHRDNILEGNGGDDILCGNSGNDTLIGGDGNDGLNGEKGNDILIGERGNDNLYGGSGDDTYVYNKGDGVDYIYDIEGNDTLKFGKGIKKEDLVVSVSKNKEKLSQYDDTHRVMDIKIGFKNNDTDAVFLRGNIIDKCTNKDMAIENFEFENGDRLSFEDIKKLALTGDDTNNLLYGYDDINNVMNGLGGDDEIQGGELNDTIYGGTGNDTISGDKGDDTIYGGEGNDTINGGSGDDIIEGGKGDDVIKGGWGDDTYIFNKGDGNDTIADYEDTDTLQLGEGITKEDIIVKHTSEGTIIKFKNSKNDSISLGRFGIDRIKFANGEELSSEDIEKLELIGTDEADTIFGNSDQDNLIIGGKGDDILYGSYSGNNTFVYNQGDGADTIYAGTHENKIKFGKGINKEDLIVERCVNTDARDYDNLKISFRNSASDSIMLTYIIKDNINAQEIQTFEFANGDKLNFGDIKRLSLIGTDKNEELRGYNDMDNEIKGGNGDDILIGGNGVNNILEGGSGNDTLRGCYDSYGNPGISMNGKNTFVFSRGDGNDMVENFKDNDLIKFKDIGSNEVKFNLNLVDNSLLISDKLSNSSVLIKNYDVRTNLNFQFKDGKILGSDFISGQVKPIDGGNTMVGGKEDNVFIYDGGAKTIMDLGGYDKVIYKNPVKRVRYDFGKNGSSDLKLIITPADPNAKNDILEVKGFFSNRDNVIEEFHIGKYLNIKAADIYKAFGKTYIASAKPAALAMDAKLDIDNETQISPLSKSSSDGSNSKSGWDMVLSSGDKNELKAIVSKYCDDSNLNTPDLNSNLSVSNAMDLNSAPGVIQEEALKDNAFLSQDTVNKIIEQLNIYADNSEALEFNQRDIRKDDMQVYMS